MRRQTRLRPSQGGKMHEPVGSPPEVDPMSMTVGGVPMRDIANDVSCHGCGYHVCSCADISAWGPPRAMPTSTPNQIYVSPAQYRDLVEHGWSAGADGIVVTEPIPIEPAPRPFKVGDRVEWYDVSEVDATGVVMEVDEGVDGRNLVQWSDVTAVEPAYSDHLRHAAPVSDE